MFRHRHNGSTDYRHHLPSHLVVLPSLIMLFLMFVQNSGSNFSQHSRIGEEAKNELLNGMS